jgi:hypothetical protein
VMQCGKFRFRVRAQKNLLSQVGKAMRCTAQL